MKGYKAFKKGLICDPTGQNPFQYAENTVFETDTAEPCVRALNETLRETGGKIDYSKINDEYFEDVFQGG